MSSRSRAILEAVNPSARECALGERARLFDRRDTEERNEHLRARRRVELDALGELLRTRRDGSRGRSAARIVRRPLPEPVDRQKDHRLVSGGIDREQDAVALAQCGERVFREDLLTAHHVVAHVRDEEGTLVARLIGRRREHDERNRGGERRDEGPQPRARCACPRRRGLFVDPGRVLREHLPVERPHARLRGLERRGELIGNLAGGLAGRAPRELEVGRPAAVVDVEAHGNIPRRVRVARVEARSASAGTPKALRAR